MDDEAALLAQLEAEIAGDSGVDAATRAAELRA